VLPDDIDLLLTPGTPAVLPDGSGAVVSLVRPDRALDEYVGALWTVALDDGADPRPRPLTRGHRDTAPDVSPDGRWVAFLRASPGGRPQVHVVPVTGGEPVAVTTAPLGAASPRFSPDGTRVAYLARVPEAGRYAPGAEAAAEGPRHITAPQYRADGIGFTRDRRQHLFVADVAEVLRDPAPGATAPDVPAASALTVGDLDVGAFAWHPDGESVLATAAVHPTREQDLCCDAVRAGTTPTARTTRCRPPHRCLSPVWPRAAA